ncbi:ribosomal protein S18-alanine N-acetyltransferase [bacterium]|nr:ribosomal protein S18-alanine N-acetyltransferase [bacterium]
MSDRSKDSAQRLRTGCGEWRLYPMQQHDLDQVMDIEHYSFPTPWRRHMYESDLRSNNYSRFYVVRDNGTGELVGYIGSWFVNDEAHVGTIATKREYRGKRLAEQMLAYTALQAQGEGVSYMILEVREHNEAAIQLYDRLGFERIGLRHRYYVDTGEDAILMTSDRLGELAERLCLEESR